MSKVAIVRRKVALPVIESCPECRWYDDCGGIHDHSGLFANTCFARHCCGGRELCNYLCPANPRFATMLNEVNGLQFDLLPEFVQRRVALPGYIPSVLHHYSRVRPLDMPFAAIPLREVLHVRGEHMVAVASSPEELRQRLLLGPQTRVLLNCIRPDDEIERLWEYWVQDDVPAQLSALGIDMVLAPNFSHLRGVPRTEILGNRMRHLMCLCDFRAAGLNAVPHLSAIEPQDWDFWRRWLIRNPKVRYTSFEFETGYKVRVDGLDAVGRLACLQKDVGRELHLIVVGGTQYREEIRGLFRKTTFIDGRPFWGTIQRERARLSAGQLAWSPWHTDEGDPLDDLFSNNFSVYTRWMDS